MRINTGQPYDKALTMCPQPVLLLYRMSIPHIEPPNRLSKPAEFEDALLRMYFIFCVQVVGVSIRRASSR